MTEDPLLPALKSVDPGDLEAIAAMARQIWPIAYREIITSGQIEYMLETMYSRSSLEHDIQDSGICYDWILANNRRIGFLAYGPVSAGSSCFLHKFYLETELQGQGLGTGALRILLHNLAVAGASGLELRVNRHNHRAIGFYRRNRFEIKGEDCLDIGNGFVMDDFLMFRTCD